MNIMVGITMILITQTIMVVTVLTMADTRAGESVWDMDLADGALECHGDILTTPTMDTGTVMDTMIPGIHGVMEVTTVVPTGVVIITDTTTGTGMAIMTEDIIIQLPMHMEKWIAEALTGTPGLREAVPEVPADQQFWIPRRPFQELVHSLP